jgi:hypothetical protein
MNQSAIMAARCTPYVVDEVIISWPITADPARDARCLLCFIAIERKMARLAAEYRGEFEVAPAFRAGLHAGPVIVSECGDAKRQLAFFGDTMSVAARLCEYCKAVDQRLVVSGDLLRGQTHRGAGPARANHSACDRNCVNLFACREGLERCSYRSKVHPPVELRPRRPPEFRSLRSRDGWSRREDVAALPAIRALPCGIRHLR